MARNKMVSVSHLIFTIAIIVGINILSSFWNVQYDLTQDRRHSLSPASIQLISQVDEPILITILLEGKFPAGFKRLRQSTKELMQKFRGINSNFQFQFQNPSIGTVEQINQRRSELAKDGLMPTSLRYQEGDEMTNKQIYPYAILNLGSRNMVINLLEEQQVGISDEVVLNHSVSLLEYKFTDGIKKLLVEQKPTILFTSGNAELNASQTSALEFSLRQYYQFDRVNLDSVYGISEEVDLVIVAKPKIRFSDRSKFILDQYIMRGGKIMWLIDPLEVNLDSINQSNNFIPTPIDLNLEDFFFSSGIRFQNDLVLDLECSRIPQVIGMRGEQPQIELMPWPYHPLIRQDTDHPIVKNIDRVNLFFPGSIDTLETRTNLIKTAFLKSSKYTMYQMTPVRLSFEILQYGFDPQKFNKDQKMLGVVVEGHFESLYKNRLAESMLDMLTQIGIEYKAESSFTKQLFISDGDIAKNLYDEKSDRFSPLGYNKWEKQIFKGNESLMVNAIEYMLDSDGLLDSRSKEQALRLLDQVKAKAEKTKWRMINIVLPLLLLILLGIIYNYIRFRRFGR